MLSFRQDDLWNAIKPLKETEDTSGRFDVGGVVLMDTLDTFLRQISEDYLKTAWMHVQPLLAAHGLLPSDLSWGFMIAGHTWLEERPGTSPKDFVGWISEALDLRDFQKREPIYVALDHQLQAVQPRVKYTFTSKALKWRIAPDDYATALRLIEAVCLDEFSYWIPETILAQGSTENGICSTIAQAVVNKNEHQLDHAVREAYEQYTALGFRIAMRGFALGVEDSEFNIQRTLRKMGIV